MSKEYGASSVKQQWIERWSVSRLGKAQSCQRLIYLDAIMNYRPRFSTSSAIQGTLTHAGVLEHYHKKDRPLRVDEIREGLDEAMAKVASEQDSPVEPLDRIKAEAYTLGYIEWADKEDGSSAMSDDYIVICVEQEWTAIIDGVRFSGIFDMVRYIPETQTYQIFELKTTSRKEALDVSSSYWRDLTYSNQPIVYAVALDAMLEDESHPIQNMLPDTAPTLAQAELEFVYHIINTTKSKPGQKKTVRKRKSETDEEFALRREENQETLDEWAEKVIGQYKSDMTKYLEHKFVLMPWEIDHKWLEIIDIINMTNSSRQFPRNTGSCGDFGGCAFRKICSGDDKLETSDRLIKKEVKDDRKLVEF